MRLRSLLIIGAGASFATGPASAGQPPVQPGWAVDCRAGEDGFAHNCEAIRAVGDYALRLVTADAQLFVSIVHARCEPNYRNFDRTDAIGLAAAERRALVERAFHEIAREIRSTCPTLVPPALSLEAMPDLAILSPDSDH